MGGGWGGCLNILARAAFSGCRGVFNVHMPVMHGTYGLLLWLLLSLFVFIRTVIIQETGFPPRP